MPLSHDNCYTDIFYKKFLLNALANYITDKIHCFHNNRKQKKNEETFSTDARPNFIKNKCVYEFPSTDKEWSQNQS